MPELKTKRGRLTPYGFACGCVEWKTTDANQFRTKDIATELYREGGVYHVRVHDRTSGSYKRAGWESFTRLSDAREFFDEQPGEMR